MIKKYRKTVPEVTDNDKKWWHDKVAYQIYPKSFYDSNGDGIGDLPGVISKLDYLKDLGVDILWLSPCYRSPLADQGYDISDYYDIDPRFGTLEDMERLIAEAGKRGMYILMDLVVNHCSDEHEWFRKACGDPDGTYGNFFYLRDKQEGKLPTNWRSYFGGPVWDDLPGTDKQYLHVFHKKQPDLNWENPEVREEIYKNINWWLDKGLGGFRIDAIINIKKALPLRSYEPDRDDYKRCCFEAQKKVGDIGFLSNIIENHDEPRGVSRYLPESDCCDQSKKMLAALNFMLRGIPFIYQGQELGMENVPFSSIDEVDDISTLDEYQVALNAGLSPEEALRAVSRYSRDNARTPMQWSDEANAGFTTGIPWLRVNPNYPSINAASQMQNPDSVRSFYKALIALRKDPEYRETVVYGALEPLWEDRHNLMAYSRTGDKTLYIIGNYQKEEQSVTLPAHYRKVLLNNCPDLVQESCTIHLHGYQVLILEM